MPALSSTMTEGKIVSWLMSEGDAIGKGDAVVVVESDKADMDVESFVDGIIAHIAVEDGEMATVGAPIAYVVDDESEIAEAKAKSGGCGARAGAGGARAGAGRAGGGVWTHRRDAVREEAREEAQGRSQRRARDGLERSHHRG